MDPAANPAPLRNRIEIYEKRGPVRNCAQAMRASQSRMVMNQLHRALLRLKTSHRFLPRSLMGVAIDYALSQWPTLLVYLEDGRLEIDNNLIENAIRPTAVGKNYREVPDYAKSDRWNCSSPLKKAKNPAVESFP